MATPDEFRFQRADIDQRELEISVVKAQIEHYDAKEIPFLTETELEVLVKVFKSILARLEGDLKAKEAIWSRFTADIERNLGG
jgi:hypothetical protein